MLIRKNQPSTVKSTSVIDQTVIYCRKHIHIQFSQLKIQKFHSSLISLIKIQTLSFRDCISSGPFMFLLTVINNLSTFIFGLIRAIGMILLGFGIVQVGLSLKSHDPSQRANGFLTLAGGVIITFAKEILNLITG